MEPADRRSARRYDLQVPLRIRALRSSDPEREVQSENLSEQGVYFMSDSPFPKGVAVQLLVEMPPGVTGDPERRWKCLGHVVHSQGVDSAPGKFGVGVRFDYFEVLNPVRESC